MLNGGEVILLDGASRMVPGRDEKKGKRSGVRTWAG
jgi:hypothetical protein